ncbi:hypothetical protein M9Y10_016998 [Tritrichomonas musculus]|uniref:Surface antigen BspA-like n=1 Tax=Tritrichomonas musculus TaxID=1915356 RepID=A0ABR2HY22_9EUKA
MIREVIRSPKIQMSSNIVNGKALEGDCFFKNVNLSVVKLSNSIQLIGDCVFLCCSSLTQVIIPSSVTSIGYDAFSGCTSLTQIIIPSSLKSISKCAFKGCTSLSQITFELPSSVTLIEKNAFSG